MGQHTNWTTAIEKISTGNTTDPHTPLTHTLTINFLTQDAASPTLTTTWTWPEAITTTTDITELADSYREALNALTRHAQLPRAGGRTPSDIPLLNLAQADIDHLENVWKKGK